MSLSCERRSAVLIISFAGFLQPKADKIKSLLEILLLFSLFLSIQPSLEAYTPGTAETQTTRYLLFQEALGLQVGAK